MSAEPLPATAPPKASGWSLRLRVVSAILFVPLLILLARAGGFAFTGFVALQVFLGIGEFYRMMRGKGLHPSALLGTLTALLDRLDRESLAAQRRITVPFLRQLLS